MQTLIGYTLFYKCITFSNNQDTSAPTSCIYEGPGSLINNYLEFLGFAVQVLLIWIALLLLPCTKMKGLPKFRYAEENKKKNEKRKFKNKDARCCCCSYNIERGGRLKLFMLIDFYITILIVIFFLVVTFVFKASEEY